MNLIWTVPFYGELTLISFIIIIFSWKYSRWFAYFGWLSMGEQESNMENGIDMREKINRHSQYQIGLWIRVSFVLFCGELWTLRMSNNYVIVSEKALYEYSASKTGFI